MPRVPDNNDNVIDSRDVLARIGALTEEQDDHERAIEEAQEDYDEVKKAHAEADTDFVEAELLEQEIADAQGALEQWDKDNGAELAALNMLAAQAESYTEDWRHGAQLIRESYFETHARELASECGPSREVAAVLENWPYRCIDWKQAAEELQMDYTSVDFDGVTYYVR